MKGHIEFEKFLSFMEKCFNPDDHQVVFKNFTCRDILLNRFSYLLKDDPLTPDTPFINYRGMESFFNSKISIKFPLKKYMALGLKTAQHFVEKAKTFYTAQFHEYDPKRLGIIDFKTFERLIRSLDPLRPQWRIISIFETATGKKVDSHAVISF